MGNEIAASADEWRLDFGLVMISISEVENLHSGDSSIRELVALARAVIRWEKWEREVWEASGCNILGDSEMSEGYAAEKSLRDQARRFAE